MCPFTSLPAGEGPERFSPSAISEWQPRRKSINNACERCRRRKIRCDGDTPCATCRRFSLQCVRTQKPREVVASEHQQALESRIHQLEAQLAAHVNAPMHGMESIDQSLMEGVSTFDWQSPAPQPLTVDTSYPTPYSAGSEMDLGPFSAGSLPSIAITEPEASPVPSFWSGTTRASSPERGNPTSAPQLPPNLSRVASIQPFSPLSTLHSTPSWEFMEGASTASSLKPQPSTTDNRDRSRRSSISSSSIESEGAASSPFEEQESDVDVRPLAPAPRLPRQGIFSAHTESPPPAQQRAGFSDRSRAVGVIPFPSRFEAETLTSEFVQHLESLEGPKPYTVSPALFGRFCESVYPDPKNRSSSVDPSFSVQMARFHVFLAMAIGMKVRIKDSVEPTNALLDRCYELAMQQASTSVFWQETGGIEASQLLSIFASIRKETVVEPKPLQSSFSW